MEKAFQWFYLRIRTLPGYADPLKGRVLLTVHILKLVPLG
jgi:hypothetical protein